MKNRLRAWRPIALVAAMVLLPSCASRFVGQRSSSGDSLLVVHLDLSKSPSYWRKLAVLCETRSGERPWWRMRTDGDGLYFQEGVPRGRCWLTAGFQDGIVTRIYKLPANPDQNPTTLAIASPGVHYMGSFRYQPSGDDFRLVATKAVSEAEALRRVLPFTEGMDWSALVRARMGRR